MDRVLEIMDEYQDKIYEIEHDILLNPGMSIVRRCTSPLPSSLFPSLLVTYPTPVVHILSGDFIMHKRILEPIKSMIYGLRRYDLDRSIALAEFATRDSESGRDGDGDGDVKGRDREMQDGEAAGKKGAGKRKIEGYMSYKAKIYLVCGFFRLGVCCGTDAREFGIGGRRTCTTILISCSRVWICSLGYTRIRLIMLLMCVDPFLSFPSLLIVERDMKLTGCVLR